MHVMENITHHLEIETISPVHIGAGSEKEWIRGLDFIQVNDKVYVLDLNSLKNYFSIDELANIVRKRDENKIKERVTKLSNIARKKGIFEFEYDASQEIKTQIRSGLNNLPLIPGSSIKGSIRSILFKALKKRGITNTRKIFGFANKGNDFMRFFKISDAAFENTQLIQTKIHNLFHVKKDKEAAIISGWKHKPKNNTTIDFKSKGFHTTYEIIPRSEKSALSLTISAQQFHKVKDQNNFQKKASIINYGDISSIMELINKHTAQYIEKEIAYFKKHNEAEYSTKIINFYEFIGTLVPKNKNSCMLRLGAGSGFHNVTGDWKHEDSHEIDFIDYNRKPSRGKYKTQNSAKSRKIAFERYDEGTEFMPMGYILLTLKQAQ